MDNETTFDRRFETKSLRGFFQLARTNKEEYRECSNAKSEINEQEKAKIALELKDIWMERYTGKEKQRYNM